MRSYYPTGSAWKRAIGSLRHESLRTFAFKLAAELGYRRVVLLERRLDESIPDAPPAAGTAFALLGEDGIDEYLAFRPESDRAGIAAQLARGDQCFVLRHDGRVVSACWASFRRLRTSFLDDEIPLDEGDVYVTEAWTHEDFRGRSYAHVLCVHQLRDLRARGFRRALRSTVPENYSALRAHAKSGFRPIAMIGRIRIGPWRRHFRRDWRGTRP
jgi:ribosomal protein S18 acetylase RimI-like enzyme